VSGVTSVDHSLRVSPVIADIGIACGPMQKVICRLVRLHIAELWGRRPCGNRSTIEVTVNLEARGPATDCRLPVEDLSRADTLSVPVGFAARAISHGIEFKVFLGDQRNIKTGWETQG
jgi:hypothetical protein